MREEEPLYSLSITATVDGVDITVKDGSTTFTAKNASEDAVRHFTKFAASRAFAQSQMERERQNG